VYFVDHFSRQRHFKATLLHLSGLVLLRFPLSGKQCMYSRSYTSNTVMVVGSAWVADWLGCSHKRGRQWCVHLCHASNEETFHSWRKFNSFAIKRNNLISLKKKKKMTKPLPYSYEEASDEEKQNRKKFYVGDASLMVNIVRWEKCFTFKVDTPTRKESQEMILTCYYWNWKIHKTLNWVSIIAQKFCNIFYCLKKR